MTIEEVRRLINEKALDMAFIVGNGINYYYNEGVFSWVDLLKGLWKRITGNEIENLPSGVSLTELFDILSLNSIYSKKEMLQFIYDELNGIEPNDDQNLLITKISELNCPLLTTNFDDLIPKSMNLSLRKLDKKGFTDYYPWTCYYSDRDLDLPTSGFGVWYINGMLKYKRSIKLGLTEYMGNVSHARKLIHKYTYKDNYDGKNQNHWEGHKSWLHIIFNKSLFITGLSLEVNETFLRWLLLERKKYFNMFPNRAKKGWYICKTEERESSNFRGKELFLKSVGFDIVTLENYDQINKEIWE